MKSAENFEIAPGYRVGAWKKLVLDPASPKDADWPIAIDILRQRIERRFFDPAEELIRADEIRERRTFGFSVLAIAFLVVETLQGFREGVIDHTGKSGPLFKGFLEHWDDFEKCAGRNSNRFAERVYKDGRCALHHSGSTGGDFRVVASGPMFTFGEDGGVCVNRTLFCKNLKTEFEKYLAELSHADVYKTRANFLRKMEAICKFETEEVQ